MSREKSDNCYDVIRYLDPALRTALGPDREYYMLGGTTTTAIVDVLSGGTRIDHDTKRIITGPDLYLSVTRENGTKRDVDLLVKGVVDEEEAVLLGKIAKEVVEDKLKISVFGLDERQTAMSGLARLKKAAQIWTSKRTIDQDGVIRQELYPLSQILPDGSFEPYRLMLSGTDNEIDVLNPAGHMLAYRMRSIGGERHKDKEKLAKMKRVVDQDPILTDQVHDNELFKPWLDFAEAIVMIRDGQPEYEYERILRDEGVGLAGLVAFRIKSKLLHWAESKEKLINIGQSPVGEKVLRPFVGDR